MKHPVVSLRGVGSSFRLPDSGGSIPIIRDINLDVLAGEILCVVGPSGCGKSTLLNGIGGFRPFTQGVARIEGSPIGPPSRDRGVVFQDYPVLDFLTAVQNVAVGLELGHYGIFASLLPLTFRRRSHQHLREAMEYLRIVGLEEHAHKYPSELSGGQKQRVAIAQAVATKPKVLLMDEPFSGLDPDSRERLQLVVLQIHRELRNTIFFVTHDLEEAVFLGNRVVVMSQHSHGAAAGSGATIVHEQALDQYNDPVVKQTARFGELIALLRAQYYPSRHVAKRAETLAHAVPMEIL